MPATPSPKPPAPRPLSEMAQAAVSVALAIYLTGLLLTIAANSVSGSSALLQTIKGRMFSPWMAPAWLDLGFDHPLTYGAAEDADHILEVRGWSRDAEPIRRPGPQSGERGRRWRRLARGIAAGALQDAAAPLAAGVGRGGFEAVGTDDVTVRVLRWPLADPLAPPTKPRLLQTYAARVREVDGEIQLLELGGEAKRGELAPLLPGPSAGAEPGPASQMRESQP
jgi:hypothetical protein